MEAHDADGNGWLDAAERAEARKVVDEHLANRPQRRRRGGRRGGGGGEEVAAEKGPKVAVGDVPVYGDADLYDSETLRTFFLEFEAETWEEELAAFKSTDVEIPATLTVDGEVFPGVGVSFRGASSFMMVPAGFKRSFNLSMDLVDGKQRLLGRKSLNLLNGNGDASFMSSVLYSGIARQYLPAPKANFVRVVVNGESWGVYSNVEQFNKDFLKDNFGSSKGTRWKVSGSPRGDGGLRYLGEEVEPYRERFAIKSKENEEAWTALIDLCQVLNETPTEELEEALAPILDVDSLLWFLALDVGLVNSDGYWVRASDYSLFLDGKGMFHVVPHDMNEALNEGHGGGGPRRQRGGRPGAEGPGAGDRAGDRTGAPSEEPKAEGRGAELDPLVGLDDVAKPLRSRILAVPSFRARYLHNMRTLAERDLSWDSLGPRVAGLRTLIADEVKAGTKKRVSYDDFMAMTAPAPETDGKGGGLYEFTKKRRAFLLANGAVVPQGLAVRQSVVINELMARNTTSFADDAGRYSDWIELHNSSDAEVSLAGLSLSDDSADLSKWSFPEGAKIPANGYLVILADGTEASEAGRASSFLHANFKLSKSGESLMLTGVDEGGQPMIVDSVRFGEQGKDEAVGRSPQGAAQWTQLLPTPGAPNRVLP